MKTIILLSLLAITLRQIYGGDEECITAQTTCATKHNIVANTTCNDKLPFFECLREMGCNRDDPLYKAHVSVYKYEKCGASAIIMGWTLPILMFTVAKYSSMY